MELTAEDVQGILEEFYQYCADVRAAGGIPLYEARDGREIPDGWVLDHRCDYFVPPHFSRSRH